MVNNVTNILKKHTFGLVLLALLILLPITAGKSADIQNMLIYIMIYALVGEGWNLISGFTGQTSFGHAAYFGIGAYTVAVMGNYYNITPHISIWVGAVIAALVAMILNYQLFRLKGHYFAIATLAVCEILRTLFSVWPYVGAGDGIKILFRTEDKFFWMALDVQNRLPFFYLTLAFFVAVFIVCVIIENSKLGYYSKAIRESHEVAESIGINPQIYKVYMMMISAAIAAIGGGLYVQFFKYVDSFVFGLSISMIFVLVTVLGGLGNVYGPPIGAAIYYILELVMRRIMGGTSSGINLIVFGALLVIVVCYQPRGIVGIFEDMLNRRRKRKQEKIAPPATMSGGDQ